MTNIFGRKEKISRKAWLFQLGVQALEQQGWSVERIPGIGKSSVRRVLRASESKQVSIRTSQDTWIAFPRKLDNSGWNTLGDVDLVVAVSVDDGYNPKFGQAHIIDGNEMRGRFDRAYKARIEAGYRIPPARGIWISLYHEETNEPVTHVGAGAGLVHPFVLRKPLPRENSTSSVADERLNRLDEAETVEMHRRLTIAEAKRGLALTFGVDPSNVKITVES